ncbi:MAG: TonB-dependent receptor [Deltaproteobacteria bacterium]|nr:TonB-dependent receptor [Deltaproteobacteria bacterium]
MFGGVDILGALSRPLRALVDPNERIFWVFLLSAVVMPWLVLGLRRGTVALREGLLRRSVWGSASSRADLTLLFVKAGLGAVARVPWLAATAGAALWVGLSLHRWLGPAAPPEWSRTTIAIVYSLVLFVGWDFSRFALHWLMHRVRPLWAFHQVHHSARVLTPLTLYRTHPVETMLYDLRGLVTTAIITGGFSYLFAGRAQMIELFGINALGFVFNLAAANLRHSHVWLRFGHVERWLLSPAQHQVHHAWQDDPRTSNLGTWLAVWDRLAGTWRAAPEQAPDRFGLADANHRFDAVTSMLLGPLRDLLPQRWRSPTMLAVLGAWLMPGSATAASETTQPPSTAPTETAPDGTSSRPDDGPATPSDHGAPDSTTPPSDPEATPSDPEATPSDPEATPSDPGATPSDPGATPSDPGATSPRPSATPEPTTNTDGETATADASADDMAGFVEPIAESAPVPDEPAPLEDVETDDVRRIDVGSMFATEEVPRVAGSAHVIGEQELERHEYDDIHRILNTVPGVYVRGEDGFGLRPNIGLRGANPDRSAKITLLEDGVLMGPAPYSAPAAYYFPLATRMVGMEVFKGPASIQYGPNTIGGAINLVTREIPEQHTAGIDLAGGRFGYAKGHAFYGTTWRGFGVLIEAARIQTTGFKELDNGADTGFAKNDAMIKLAYGTDRERRITHDIELKGGIGTEDSDETYLGISADDFQTTPYRRYAASAADNMSWWRSQAELTYLLRQDDTLEVEARAYRHDFDRVWRRLDAFDGGPSLTDILAAPGAGQAAVFSAILRGEQDSLLPQQTLLVTNNDRRFVSQGVQAAFRWRPSWGIVHQDLEVGARVHNDRIDRDHTEDALLMVSGTLVPEGTPRVDTVQNTGQTVAAAFHVHDAVTLWDRLTVAPGVRLEVISMRFEDRQADTRSRRLDTAVTPGLGALMMIKPWLGVFGGVHRGFSPVAPGQPEEVQVETSLNYELGARVVHQGLWVEAVGFVSDYRNLVGACTFSAGCIDGDGSQQVNAGAALVYGAESLARYRYRFDNGFGFEVGGRYTYTGSQFRRTFSSTFPQWGEVTRGDQLPYVPEHIVGGTVGVGGRRWDVSVSPNYNGPMRDIAGQGSIPVDERIDGFFVLDVSAEVRAMQRFRIYTQLGNVTNTAYVASRRPFGIRPGAPLTFMLGVKADLFP